MKRFICIILLAFLTLNLLGQKPGTLKFLGIPVDGSKEEMISKLKEKGFSYNSLTEEITGEFNGQDVTIYLRTHHRLVDRVCVVFPSASKRYIIPEYNNLLTQFQENEKYMEYFPNSMIPETEDIDYEMLVNNKKYSATFFYISPDLFTKEEATMIRQKASEASKMTPEEMQSVTQAMADSLQNSGSHMNKEQELLMVDKLQSILAGHVWFTILEDGSRFQIALYYDNLNNSPRGEDL